MSLQTIATGSYARDDSGRKAVLAKTDAEFAQQWEALIGDDARPPAVNLTKQSIVFLLAGSRRSGGWSIEPKSVTMEGTTAVIDAAIVGPPPGGIATMALSSPWAVVAVDSRKVDSVRWNVQ